MLFSNLRYRMLNWQRQLRSGLQLRRQKQDYMRQKNKSIRLIKRLDAKPIPSDLREIRLFAIMRNESLRLPHFMEYYRKLGVNRFFLLDNGSSDGSPEMFQYDANVHLFSTLDDYKDHWYWMEHLLEKYGKGHWCVVADIDELFYYPGAENLSLQDLSRYMEKAGETAINTFLLDMYPEATVGGAQYAPGENPLNVVPYFDEKFEKIKFQFYDRVRWRPYFFDTFTGGVRDRIFGKSNPPSILSKVPFFKNTEETYLSQGMHAIAGATLSGIRGVVFHTKFLSDFIAEVQEECEREQHYGGAFYYKIFNQKLAENPAVSFYHEGSQKFQGSGQLIGCGIMITTPEFEAFAQEKIPQKESV